MAVICRKSAFLKVKQKIIFFSLLYIDTLFTKLYIVGEFNKQPLYVVFLQELEF